MITAPPSITTVLATFPLAKVVGESSENVGPAPRWIGPETADGCSGLADAAVAVNPGFTANTGNTQDHRQLTLIVLAYEYHDQSVDPAWQTVSLEILRAARSHPPWCGPRHISDAEATVRTTTCNKVGVSRYIDTMDTTRNIWDRWQELIHSENPDLLEVLKLGAQFQAYFSTIESETLQAARMAGMTWSQLGEALGTSRQAVWQRATTWDASRRRVRQSDRSRSGDEKLVNLRKVQEDWANRRDQVAALMFDGPLGPA